MEGGGHELWYGGDGAHHEGDEHRAAQCEGHALPLAGGGALGSLSVVRHHREGASLLLVDDVHC